MNRYVIMLYALFGFISTVLIALAFFFGNQETVQVMSFFASILAAAVVGTALFVLVQFALYAKRRADAARNIEPGEDGRFPLIQRKGKFFDPNFAPVMFDAKNPAADFEDIDPTIAIIRSVLSNSKGGFPKELLSLMGAGEQGADRAEPQSNGNKVTYMIGSGRSQIIDAVQEEL